MPKIAATNSPTRIPLFHLDPTGIDDPCTPWVVVCQSSGLTKIIGFVMPNMNKHMIIGNRIALTPDNGYTTRGYSLLSATKRPDLRPDYWEIEVVL